MYSCCREKKNEPCTERRSEIFIEGKEKPNISDTKINIVVLGMENLSKLMDLKSSPELIEKLYSNSIHKSYAAGTTILNENAYIRSIPIVTKGSIKVIRTEPDGREILLYYIKAGESCIISFLGGLHDETSKVKAEVEEDAEILFLPVIKYPYLLKNIRNGWITFSACVTSASKNY